GMDIMTADAIGLVPLAILAAVGLARERIGVGTGLLLTLTGAAITGIGAYDWHQIKTAPSDLISVGWGLQIAVVSGIAIGLHGLYFLREARTETPETVS